MNHYIWMVWKDCRLAGYIQAFSEREAVIKSKEKFGERTFVERMIWSYKQDHARPEGQVQEV